MCISEIFCKIQSFHCIIILLDGYSEHIFITINHKTFPVDKKYAFYSYFCLLIASQSQQKYKNFVINSIIKKRVAVLEIEWSSCGNSNKDTCIFWIPLLHCMRVGMRCTWNIQEQMKCSWAKEAVTMQVTIIRVTNVNSSFLLLLKFQRIMTASENDV